MLQFLLSAVYFVNLPSGSGAPSAASGWRLAGLSGGLAGKGPLFWRAGGEWCRPRGPPLPSLAARDRGQRDEYFVGGQPRLTQLAQPVGAQIGITATCLDSGSCVRALSHSMPCKACLPTEGFREATARGDMSMVLIVEG